MKKFIAIFIMIVFAASALSACSLFPWMKTERKTTQPPTSGAAVVETAAPDATEQAATEAAPATAAPTEAPVGSLGDYVRTAKEASFTFDTGNTVTYRIPEILLESSDAASANSEIVDRFGDDVKTYTDYSPVTELDYEAYLNDKYLSVIVTGRYDGGNSYGLCYTFDVTTGDELNSETLCSVTGRDYNTALSTLTSNLTSEYDSKYSALPGNDTERDKTLASDNISAARMYLDGSGTLMAMVDVYAAVGGGHWVNSISAE